jgi:hypothetical protein
LLWSPLTLGHTLGLLFWDKNTLGWGSGINSAVLRATLGEVQESKVTLQSKAE